MRSVFTDASSVTPDKFCDQDYKGLNRCASLGPMLASFNTPRSTALVPPASPRTARCTAVAVSRTHPAEQVAVLERERLSVRPAHCQGQASRSPAELHKHRLCHQVHGQVRCMRWLDELPAGWLRPRGGPSARGRLACKHTCAC